MEWDIAIGNPSLTDPDIEKILDLLITFFRLGKYMIPPSYYTSHLKGYYN